MDWTDATAPDAGEIAAMALIDATVRLKPGVLGNAASTADESFSAGLLEHPQYTRPAEWKGRVIPEVLTSGDHGKVARWRRAEAERITFGQALRRAGEIPGMAGRSASMIAAFVAILDDLDSGSDDRLTDEVAQLRARIALEAGD